MGTGGDGNLSARIAGLLNSSPHGLTSAEIAARLGMTTGKVSSPLSKLAAYGVIRRTWGRPAPPRACRDRQRPAGPKRTSGFLISVR